MVLLSDALNCYWLMPVLHGLKGLFTSWVILVDSGSKRFTSWLVLETTQLRKRLGSQPEDVKDRDESGYVFCSKAK